METWKIIRLPAIAEEDEVHEISTPYGLRRFERKAGEALHPEREPLAALEHIQQTIGMYNFAGMFLPFVKEKIAGRSVIPAEPQTRAGIQA